MNSNRRPWQLFWTGLVAVLLGCTQKNPVYCLAEADCSDVRFPHCDTSITRCVGPAGDGSEDEAYLVALYVGGEGCSDSSAGAATRPYCKIQDALKDPRARNGALAIAAGIYAEDLVLDRDAILIGQPGARIQTQSCPGIQIYDGARVVLQSLELTGQGGIRVSDRASAQIRKTHLHGTSCLGVDCREATCVITRNRIQSNSRGGVALSNSQFTLVNNLIADNGSAGEFGGVHISAPQTGSVFDNNTVADNKTPEDVPGGIVCQSAVEIRNSILWQNGPEPEEKPADVSGPCTVRFSDVSQDLSTLSGTNNLSIDPLFLPTDSDEYHLRPGSPCVDRGEAQGAPTEDIDGNARPKGNGVDIGAHEAA